MVTFLAWLILIRKECTACNCTGGGIGSFAEGFSQADKRKGRAAAKFTLQTH